MKRNRREREREREGERKKYNFVKKIYSKNATYFAYTRYD